MFINPLGVVLIIGIIVLAILRVVAGDIVLYERKEVSKEIRYTSCVLHSRFYESF